MILNSFPFAYVSSVYLLRWGVCAGFLPIFKIRLFVFLSLNCLSFFFCMFPIIVFNQMSFANIFSLSVPCLILLMRPFLVEKFVLKFSLLVLVLRAEPSVSAYCTHGGFRSLRATPVRCHSWYLPLSPVLGAVMHPAPLVL